MISPKNVSIYSLPTEWYKEHNSCNFCANWPNLVLLDARFGDALSGFTIENISYGQLLQKLVVQFK